MKQYPAEKKSVPSFPTNPGVYVFRDDRQVPIYIGKAKNLKSRLSSYFGSDLLPKTQSMVNEAETVDTILVDSEFEALLLEARMVKKYMPKYNSELKDDKSPLYIIITREEYPRILAVRQTQLNDTPTRKIYGPFIDGKSVRKVLRLLRRVFPYSQHKPGKRACMYSQIGQCDPCPSVIANCEIENEKIKMRQAYLDNVRKIRLVLSGKQKAVRKQMEREISILSKEENFEEASVVQKRIRAFDVITNESPHTEEYLADPNFFAELREQEVLNLSDILGEYVPLPNLSRIECYDIAHLSGTYPTASMVTFIDGVADKSYYRHFRVSFGRQNNDTDSMQSVVKRRMNHFDDWGKPDLIIVDGGKGQVSSAEDAINGAVPIVGIAKRTETLIIPTVGGFVEKRLPEGPAKMLVQRMRDEAHRFARRYHHSLVSKAIAESGKGV